MENWWSASNNNWDLHAVVRGCSSSATVDPFSSYPPIVSKGEYRVHGDDTEILSSPELAAIHELEELCKPFFAKPDDTTPEQSSPSPSQETRQPKQPRRPTSKKGRNQQKKVVCQVPADGISADMWAWRKYGQKPIKGSPYPRGYYRCSSSKGCMARKQVERSRADPSMLVITYTGEHDHPIPTHRNSLAGSTRNKFAPSMMLTRGQVLSPRTPLMASIEEELMGEDEKGQLADLEESHKSSDLAAVDSDDDDDSFVKSFFSSR